VVGRLTEDQGLDVHRFGWPWLLDVDSADAGDIGDLWGWLGERDREAGLSNVEESIGELAPDYCILSTLRRLVVPGTARGRPAVMIMRSPFLAMPVARLRLTPCAKTSCTMDGSWTS
jgi:hypothetical protein